jgi:hypothetical protein
MAEKNIAANVDIPQIIKLFNAHVRKVDPPMV